jgi:hypothetical protein
MSRPLGFMTGLPGFDETQSVRRRSFTPEARQQAAGAEDFSDLRLDDRAIKGLRSVLRHRWRDGIPVIRELMRRTSSASCRAPQGWPGGRLEQPVIAIGVPDKAGRIQSPRIGLAAFFDPDQVLEDSALGLWADAEVVGAISQASFWIPWREPSQLMMFIKPIIHADDLLALSDFLADFDRLVADQRPRWRLLPSDPKPSSSQRASLPGPSVSALSPTADGVALPEIDARLSVMWQRLDEIGFTLQAGQRRPLPAPEHADPQDWASANMKALRDRLEELENLMLLRVKALRERLEELEKQMHDKALNERQNEQQMALRSYLQHEVHRLTGDLSEKSREVAEQMALREKIEHERHLHDTALNELQKELKELMARRKELQSEVHSLAMALGEQQKELVEQVARRKALEHEIQMRAKALNEQREEIEKKD